jgi:hypothetical protein
MLASAGMFFLYFIMEILSVMGYVQNDIKLEGGRLNEYKLREH